MSVEALKARASLTYAKANEGLIGSFKGLEEERLVKVTGKRDVHASSDLTIPVTIYTPIEAKKDKLVVFFHGGGWIMGNRKTHQTLVNLIAESVQTMAHLDAT